MHAFPAACIKYCSERDIIEVTKEADALRDAT
jgi:hypothetical protein